MIGINTTSNSVAMLRMTRDHGGGVVIQDDHFVEFEADSGVELVRLRECLRAILQQWVAEDQQGKIAILKCAEGKMSASSAAFKAEGIVQMLCAELSIQYEFVTPQSLKNALGCEKTEKWQVRAKALLNPNGAIKQWTSKGVQGAAAAAYKALNK